MLQSWGCCHFIDEWWLHSWGHTGKCKSVFGALRKNRQGSRVGIDITSATVRLLELSESNGGYRVEGYSVASLPQGAVFEKNINNVGEVATGTGGVIPSINTTELNTQVLVGNGETVVLGGVFENEETLQMQKVPMLDDIPGIGTLFRSTASANKKTETLIFITPRILSEALLD